MQIRTWTGALALALALSLPAARALAEPEPDDEAQAEAQAAEDRAKAREEARRDREQAREDREEARWEQLYDRAAEALDSGRLERAIEAYEALAAEKGKKADAALYWKAYALQKKGARAEALATLERLRKEYPQSRWLKDGQALELEIRQKGGQKPSLEGLDDDDLKIMALQGLMNADPEQALPLIEKLIDSGKSPRVREQALFVLCQSESPRAREIVTRIARGQGSPALEAKAIEYLGMFGSEDSRKVLGEIYAQSQDPDSRRAVLRSFMLAGDKARVLQAARTEKDPDVRREALQMLGMLGATAELGELYRGESDREIKDAILQGLMMAGDAKRLIEIARTEKDPQSRRKAVQMLSVMDSPEGRQFLLEILEK